MFDNVVLNIFIGLIFIFLLYSLLASILQELFASWCSLRSKMLQKALRRILQDQEIKHTALLKKVPLEIFNNLVRFFFPFAGLKGSLFEAFYQYPSIKYLAASSWNNKPSYIDAGSFSQTMLYLLRGDQYDSSIPQMEVIKSALFTTKVAKSSKYTDVPIEPETLDQLQKLFIDSHNDPDKFRSQLEKWFNDTMDRTAGWYKRQTQFMLFVIGFLIAWCFNVDTISIYKLLAKDNTARNNLVQLAVSGTSKYQPLVIKSLKPLEAETFKDSVTKQGIIRIVKQPYIVGISDSTVAAANAMINSDMQKAQNIAALGWPDRDSCAQCDSLKQKLLTYKNEQITLPLKGNKQKNDSILAANQKMQALLTKQINAVNVRFHCAGNPYQKKSTMIWGWLLTAMAISLGSPFWFDLLNKFIQLRGAGAKPEQADTKSNPPAKSPINRVG